MTSLTNLIQNSDLAALAGKASHGVVNAIKTASVRTGANFAYLIQQASAESSFNPAAKAKTSSASGLFQFIESTWMNMVEKYGDKHGIDTEGKTRKEILAMRNDPRAASLMAAEFAGENEKFLNSHWGGEIGSTELYFAHFMGAGGASAFLNARDEEPTQQAALLFPAAAKANRNVFYDTTTGRMKTLDEVYSFFDKKFQIEDGDSATLVAEAPPLPGSKPERPQDKSGIHNSVFANRGDGVIKTTNNSALPSYYQLVSSPVEVMLMAQLETPMDDRNSYQDGNRIERRNDNFSLYSKARSYNE